ncbi:hypothetical protein ACFQGT_16070 [Natrialbaceae archaeon GCM10025810]|uniref:hypothetical protein n=1 Tax=Halovalidus salilacus TaxID=3075124 RepID=UPI0036141BAD
MTSSTATSSDTGLFDSTFSTAAVVVAILSLVVGLVAGWNGYNEVPFPIIGYELDVVTGAVALTFAAGISVLALFVAAYMEP